MFSSLFIIPHPTCLLLLLLPPFVMSFRQAGTPLESTPFAPYSEGFTGRVNLPSNYLRERVNEGAPSTQMFSRLSNETTSSGNGNQSCPNMVGPMRDNKYYCGAKEYGYCDRRSGTCFCNTGYAGEGCMECTSTHVEFGGLCYPKKLCPSDCSGSGECDYLTGICTCSSFRTGADCSTLLCTAFDSLCTECDTNSCLNCIQGYSVDTAASANTQCQPCTRFDPRCHECSLTSCLTCIDPLLKSIRRSGPRVTDQPLPFDELTRELSITVPFGSLQTNAFDEAEFFEIQTANLPLQDFSRSCEQGLNSDATFTCSPYPISNLVCGHHGTLSFASPTYSVTESSKTLRIKVRRTGGGVGSVSVKYSLNHVTSTDEDVTPHAVYTTSQTLVFDSGVVELSFLVVVHDDFIYSGDKTFTLALEGEEGGAALDPQYKTLVTIVDDDELLTSAINSYTSQSITSTSWNKFVTVVNSYGIDQQVATLMSKDDTHHRSIAGENNVYNIIAVNNNNAEQRSGGNIFLAELKESKNRGGSGSGSGSGSPDHSHSHSLISNPTRKTAVDNGDGTYVVTFNSETAGKYDLHTYILHPGGLTGHYYDDAFFSKSSLTKVRIDSQINFDWEKGRITNTGSDFVSVWWGGYVKTANSEVVVFTLEFDDNVRLYVDNLLLIDMWDRTGGGGVASGSFTAIANEYHYILLQYRDVRGTAHCKLYWQSPTIIYQVIPSTNLYTKHDVRESPFNYTVIANSPIGSSSTAKGAGLFAGVAGIEHTFIIESRDLYGNWRGDYNVGYGDAITYYDKLLEDVAAVDGFVGVATLINDLSGGGFGLIVVPCDIIFNRNTRVFDASFLPTKSGEYRLDVFLTEENLGYYTTTIIAGSEHIFGSPFSVTTSPSPTFAAQSDTFGGFGNCPPSLIPGNVYDVSGNLGGAWGNWNTNDCSGTNHGLAGVTQSFEIVSRDVNHNLRLAFDRFDQWEVHARSTDVDAMSAFVGWVENGSSPGSYVAYVTPETSGEYYLDVTLNGGHAKNSPIELYVRHNDGYGPNSFIVSDDTEPWRTASCSAVNLFIIQPVDEWGNNMERSAHPYDSTTVSAFVTSDGESNTIVDATASVSPLGDGTHRASYIANVVGANKLNVLVNGIHIRDSPFDITAIPGSLNGGTSTATGAGISTSVVAGVETTFIVQSRDAKSNFRNTAADVFTVEINMQTLSIRPADFDVMIDGNFGSTASVTSTISYIGAGQFEVIYNATVSGTYIMHVRSGAADIVGSPFFPIVSPNVASGTESDMPGSGTRSGTAGVSEPVEIYTRDVFGNYLLAGGDKIRGRAALISHYQSSWEKGGEGDLTATNGILSAEISDPVGVWVQDIAVTDFGNGRYRANYIPAYSGQYALSATLDTPGGLWGSYYISADFAASQISLVRHDVSLDFDWRKFSAVSGGNPPAISCVANTGFPDDAATEGFDESRCFGNGLALPADHFSVQWDGYIEADHDEEYEFSLKCDSNSKGGIFVDNIEVLVYSDCSKTRGRLVMAAGARVSIKVRYSHGIDESHVELLWGSVSQGPLSIIPSSSLYRGILISDTVYSPVYVPDLPAAQSSTATGVAVTEAVAGITQSFVVECRDAHGGNGEWGNLQLGGGGCAVQVFGRGASGGGVLESGGSFQGSVTDNLDGTYTVLYHPVSSGSYYLTVTAVNARASADLGGYYHDLSVLTSHVVGSPFLLDVVPGETEAAASHIDVSAVGDGIVSEESVVVVWSKDVEGNRRVSGGDAYEIFLAKTAVGDDSDMNTHAVVVDNGDGTYSGTFTPKENGNVGIYKLFVVLVGEGSGVRTNVMGSPYDVTIWPSKAFAGMSHVSSGESRKDLVHAAPGGEVNVFTASANSIRTFYVQAADEMGNDWWVGGANFVGRIRGRGVELLSVVDVSDGRYKVDMTLTGILPGDYLIDVLLANTANSVERDGTGMGVVDRAGGGGLRGSYYSNLHLLGEPSFVRVDEQLDFDWGQGLVTRTAVDYVSVVWTGYVKAAYTEDITFELFNVDDYARLWIEDVLIIETSTGVGGVGLGVYAGRENVMMKIRIEYFETDRSASIELLWSSRSMARHTISKNFLFASAEPIQGSPFELTVV